jgi:predicted HicB family RNase H-like nuclease
VAKLTEDEKPFVTKDGTVLTDEVLEELVAEAERGYDLSKAKFVRVGRPALGDAGVSPRLSVRLPPDVFEAARRKADEEGVSVSEVAREAIRRYVEA